MALLWQRSCGLLWQQAGWPGYVLVKRDRERETRGPSNSWAQALTPSLQPPPFGLSNTTRTLGTPRISHSSSSHARCTALLSNLLYVIHLDHSSPSLWATSLTHTQIMFLSQCPHQSLNYYNLDCVIKYKVTSFYRKRKTKALMMKMAVPEWVFKLSHCVWVHVGVGEKKREENLLRSHSTSSMKGC